MAYMSFVGDFGEADPVWSGMVRDITDQRVNAIEEDYDDPIKVYNDVFASVVYEYVDKLEVVSRTNKDSLTTTVYQDGDYFIVVSDCIYIRREWIEAIRVKNLAHTAPAVAPGCEVNI